VISEPYVKIIVILPIYLGLDNCTSIYQHDKNIVKITAKNVVSEDPTWVGTARNMEVISDEYSHFRFTEITWRIPRHRLMVLPLLSFGFELCSPCFLPGALNHTPFWTEHNPKTVY